MFISRCGFQLGRKGVSVTGRDGQDALGTTHAPHHTVRLNALHTLSLDTGGTQQCIKKGKKLQYIFKNKQRRGKKEVPRGPAEFGDSECLSPFELVRLIL